MRKKSQNILIDGICHSLVDAGRITKKQLAEASKLREKSGTSLGRALVNLGFISEPDLMAFVAGQLDIPEVKITSRSIDQKLLKLIPEDTARRYTVIPMSLAENTLTVAMANPSDIFALEELKLQIGTEIRPVFAKEESIVRAIKLHYRGAYNIERTARNISVSSVGLLEQEDAAGASLARITEQPPIVKLVDEIIHEAVVSGASDIHIEPRVDSTSVRFRTDGVLHTIATLPKHLCVPVVSRIKILAELDIAEKMVPQDGQVLWLEGMEEASLRVSTFPTTHGEKVALRLLGSGACSLDLAKSGLTPDNLALVNRLISQPNGLMLVCGPTGCGKTTTLYSVLNVLNSDDTNIVTLEDPVEFDVPHVNQAQVQPKRGLTFASGLRAILRQDPNVIMVGEIRDLETAELAIRASLTGHLVLSTLHTTNALGVVSRLSDMGFDDFLIASSLSGAVAQRLVRCICPKCREEYKPAPEVLLSAGFPPGTKGKFYRGAGCDDCHQTGYRGRTGIYEVLYVDENLRQAIMSKTPQHELAEALAGNGYRTLLQDGIDKVHQGITTLDEVLRETKIDD